MCQESVDLFPCQTGKGNSMGQKDISLVRYFEDEDRYADLINGFIFGGERVVSGADIQDFYQKSKTDLRFRNTGIL